MGLSLNIYKKIFIKRFDKDGFIPYYSVEDFPGLKKIKETFINSKGNAISYFYYFYEGYRDDKIILFCHGLGPGHTAYMSEIVSLCKKGYMVLTLDYFGCEESGGKSIYSINSPTRDVIDLLNHLNLKMEIVLIGHSLGGYTALNVINLKKDITKAVIISGFIDIRSEMLSFIKFSFLTKEILNFEKEVESEYFGINNLKYLKETNDKILFIHSKDDNVVPYKSTIKRLKKNKNQNLSFLILNDRLHNPNYSKEAVDYLNKTLTAYNKMVKNNKFKSTEDRREWMRNKSLEKMTEQDEEVIDKIANFIE